MADSALNQFVASGTTAERTAFVPTPPTPASGPDPGYVWFDTDDNLTYGWDGANWVAPAGSGDVTASGTLTSGAIIVGGGTTVVAATATGTGVVTALGVNVGSAGAVVVNGGALGTPSSGTATNLTGLPVASGISGLGTGVATFLATPSSANLASALTDETGSGAAVFATSPTLVTPALGTPSALVLTNATGLVTAGINNSQVTLAKIANAAANDKLVGSGNSGSGAPYAEITLGSGLTMTGTTLSASGGGGGWTLVDSWTFSINVTEVILDCTGVTDFMVIVRSLTLGTSGRPQCQASVDGGSTYFTSSGDYVAIAETGVETNIDSFGFLTSANATAARSGVWAFYGNTAVGAPKQIQVVNRALTSGAFCVLFVADLTNPVDTVRITPSGGGNMTGGSIYLVGR